MLCMVVIEFKLENGFSQQVFVHGLLFVVSESDEVCEDNILEITVVTAPSDEILVFGVTDLL